jgi:hypothetical protein
VLVSESGITKVAGNAAWVTRTCVSASVIGRSVVSRSSPSAKLSKRISGWQNSRITRVIGQRSPSTAPTLAARNWRP